MDRTKNEAFTNKQIKNKICTMIKFIILDSGEWLFLNQVTRVGLPINNVIKAYTTDGKFVEITQTDCDNLTKLQAKSGKLFYFSIGALLLIGLGGLIGTNIQPEPETLVAQEYQCIVYKTPYND